MMADVAADTAPPAGGNPAPPTSQAAAVVAAPPMLRPLLPRNIKQCLRSGPGDGAKAIGKERLKRAQCFLGLKTETSPSTGVIVYHPNTADVLCVRPSKSASSGRNVSSSKGASGKKGGGAAGKKAAAGSKAAAGDGNSNASNTTTATGLQQQRGGEGGSKQAGSRYGGRSERFREVVMPALTSGRPGQLDAK